MKDKRAYEFRVTAEAISSLRAGTRKLGFVHLENALSQEVMAGLRGEAAAQWAVARAAMGKGDYSYKSNIAELGNFAGGFLADPSVVRFMQAVFEQPLELSKDASCYTYYEPGSFLSRHRDRPVECAATFIVYLEAASPDPQSPQTGLALRVFGEDDAGSSDPRTIIPTSIGSLVVGRGSSFWHERPPLQPGEQVVALTACFSSVLTPPR